MLAHGDRLRRAQAFLQAFLDRAANGHRFAHALHLLDERNAEPVFCEVYYSIQTRYSFPMTTINEIAPDLFRLSIYVPDFDMQFNHFLVRDEEPLLFHAGLKAMFPALREAVAKLVDPTNLRHIAWSHFESDECGALNDWLQLAPQAQPVCTLVGKLVSVDDFAIRPVRGMTADDVSPPASIAIGFIGRRTCRTGGMQACCSR